LQRKKLFCREIFKLIGDKAFRQIEIVIISSLFHLKDHVISIGGGSLESPENGKILKFIGQVIYLKVCPTILWERIQRDDFPANLDAKCPKESFFALASKRIPLFEKFSHSSIEANLLSEQEIVEEILNFKGVLKP